MEWLRLGDTATQGEPETRADTAKQGHAVALGGAAGEPQALGALPERPDTAAATGAEPASGPEGSLEVHVESAGEQRTAEARGEGEEGGAEEEEEEEEGGRWRPVFAEIVGTGQGGREGEKALDKELAASGFSSQNEADLEEVRALLPLFCLGCSDPSTLY